MVWTPGMGTSYGLLEAENDGRHTSPLLNHKLSYQTHQLQNKLNNLDNFHQVIRP